MIFFVGMGLMFGLINLVLPLQLGARDVAFPFMNATSFWLFAAGMGLINLSLVVGEFSAAGWLAYPPLSELQYSPGPGVDYWIWALQISGIGSLLSGINFLVTILKMRAPGMTLMKMPMFAWSVLASMTLVAFAFPVLTVTLTLLALDRTLGMHFFTSGVGGNAMMYVNLIWAWGHPEVYILVLPAFGIYSEVVATFSRKRLFGYASMVWAIMAITVLSYSVWLHHFFTMGAGANVNAFFGITTGIIAIPTGVKIFNWLFTMYKGRIHFATPMLWFMGFVVIFTIGGVMAGVAFQILQLIVSIWQRDQRRDLSGDPWNGRTLEWSIPSPAPFYSFAKTPVVTERDQFWADKQAGKKRHGYEDILLPKNSGASVFIAGFAFMIGFGIIWHIWWLAIASLLGLVVTMVVRASNPEPEYILTAGEVEKIENALKRRKQLA
jgi:heme/copper-type cytochrome/quinol oxidase subunit 1